VFTLGGLVTTVDGHVLDLDGNPIAGLYAAGRSTSGLASWGYVSGTSLGDGTYFGRRAGRAAAGSPSEWDTAPTSTAAGA
jgi:3-oxo-5alpha-steroid 4-dehydrogenase